MLTIFNLCKKKVYWSLSLFSRGDFYWWFACCDISHSICFPPFTFCNWNTMFVHEYVNLYTSIQITYKHMHINSNMHIHMYGYTHLDSYGRNFKMFKMCSLETVPHCTLITVHCSVWTFFIDYKFSLYFLQINYK